MFTDSGCPTGWPAGGSDRTANRSAVNSGVPNDDRVHLALELFENRSSLPPGARATVATVIALAVACTIGPAIGGLVLVPVAVVGATAMLWLVLEWFERRPARHETLVINAAHVRFDDHRGRRVEWPTYWTRLEMVQRGPLERRLYLRLRDQGVEVGRCIGSYERGQIAPRIAGALAMKGPGE